MAPTSKTAVAALNAVFIRRSYRSCSHSLNNGSVAPFDAFGVIGPGPENEGSGSLWSRRFLAQRHLAAAS
jgi:hypothetical protein